MGKHKFLENQNFIRKNWPKLLCVAAVALIFSLLVIEAIYLLKLPNGANGSGAGQNRQSASNNENGKSNSGAREGGKGSRNNSGQGGQGGKAIPGNGSPGDLMPDIKKDITKGIQDVQIDVGDDMSGLPSFGGDGSITIRNGNKPSHSPIIEIAGVCGTQYLRMTSMDSFGQNKWRMDANSDYEVYKAPGGPTENSVKLKPFNAANGFVPVPSNSKAIKFPVKDVVKFKNDDLYYSANPISDYYEVYQSYRLPDENGLESASVEYVKSPSKNMDRIINLAKDITNNYDKPYDKIKAVESYLADNCIMDSGYKRTQKNIDATFDLLFGSKKGNALNFMSAFVVLLKCADIPARINVGYQVDPGVNYQVVYADQLRVFTEVDFKEYGWVPISFLNDKGFVPPVSTSTDITQVENTAKKGSSFNVKGTVKDSSGKPVDGIDVLIFLKKDKKEGCLSYVKGHVTNGEFDVTGQLDRDIDVGTYNVVAFSLENDKYLSSWSDPLMKVTADTVINIKAPQTVMEGLPFTINCSILEDMAAKPVKTGSLKLAFGEGIKPEISGKNVFINGDAQNVVKLSVDASLVPCSDYFLFNFHKTSYKVSYIGDEFYSPSEAEGSIYICTVLWIRVIILLLCIGLIVFISLFIMSRKKRASVITGGIGVVALEDGSSFNYLQYHTSEEKETVCPVSIVFPEIKDSLPQVWGINEPLTVRFGQSGDFHDKSIIFTQKGSVNITVYTENRLIAGNANIRIVLYREEIIESGKKLLSVLQKRFDLINGERMTLREINRLIPIEQKQTFKTELDNVVFIFEKAVYSDKAILRNDYEVFAMGSCKIYAEIGGINNGQKQ